MSALEKAIVNAVQKKNNITYDELSGLLNKARATIHRTMRQLNEKGLVRRVGADKGGHWEVMTTKI